MDTTPTPSPSPVMPVASVSISAPTGVKVIAVLDFLSAALLIIVGIFFLIGFGFLSTVITTAGTGATNIGSDAVAGAFGGQMASAGSVIAVILIGLAILPIVAGIGLWKGKNWARILTIVLGVISALSNLKQIADGEYNSVISLAIVVLILWYLIGNVRVKQYFSRPGA